MSGTKLYIRGFPETVDERALIRQFGRKKVSKVELIEKKDDSGVVISRFCYLHTNEPEQAQAIVAKWDGRQWDGEKISVKVARESFMERAAKLKQTKTQETQKEAFKPLFKAAKFEQSDSSDSSSEEEDEEEKPQRPSASENASARLHDKVRARREAEIRRQDAQTERQERYEARKGATFKGTKITFSDSDQEEEEEEIKEKKTLFSGSEDEEEFNIEDKIRDEHEGPDGAKLFQFEQANFKGDNRFKMGEEFKGDLADMKSSSEIVTKTQNVEKRNQFKAPQRFIPRRETAEEEDQRLKDEIQRLKAEKEKFTNVKAPTLEDTGTHFGLTGTLQIGTEEWINYEPETGGFSLLSMFGRQIEDDEDEKDIEEEKETEEIDSTEEPEPMETDEKVPKAKKVITFGTGFSLFPESFDNTGFYMEEAEIRRQRESLRDEASAEYGVLARQGKKRRQRDDTLRGQSKVQQVLNWW